MPEWNSATETAKSSLISAIYSISSGSKSAGLLPVLMQKFFCQCANVFNFCPNNLVKDNLQVCKYLTLAQGF